MGDAAEVLTTEATPEAPEAVEATPAVEPPAAPEPPKEKAHEKLAKALAAKEAKLSERRAERAATERAEKAEREAAELREWKKSLGQNIRTKPLQVYKDLGVEDPNEVLDGIVRDGKPPTPDEKRDAELAEMRAWRAQVEEERKQLARQQDEHRRDQALTHFQKFVDASDAYPYLASMKPDVVGRMAIDIAKQTTAAGHNFSDEEIAEYLEHQVKTDQEEYEQRRSQRLSARTQRDAGSERQEPGQVPHESRAKARTLTNGSTNTVASPPRSMTDDEMDAWALEELRRARKPRNS